MLKLNAIQKRHWLHQHPELSGNERETARQIVDWLRPLKPTQLMAPIGGRSVWAIWDSGKPGRHIMFRAELDALPIEEELVIEYASVNKGISHKCGHDGHMAILLELACRIVSEGIEKGKVSLMFQSAEETGQGAGRVVSDPLFKENRPDEAFALHNLPGYPLHTILSRGGVFCAASIGLKLLFKGHTSHASEPEKGKNPAQAIGQFIVCLPERVRQLGLHSHTFYTITHINLGDESFGVSAGEGEVWMTIRSLSNNEMRRLLQAIESQANELAHQQSLVLEVSKHESFLATTNHKEQEEVVRQACQKLGLEVRTLPEPNLWSEDFGVFLDEVPGALLGLGSGKGCFPLHHPFYDFPDEIINTGARLFWQILINRL
ncbi:amidohydrolase [Roseivirga sp. UBA838]|uniref:amidohydrolase n=1 Tax=Roseivirga sp. UBA838 TaxID=1947393 RepID=UPI002580242E|nr:amidohydrolase [Roseivirga sp. UBA838]|tara:strand:+ start:21635 stop:22762 length:1128 start_codon:yes stop_codon:yes gene_type:complete